MFVQLPAGPDSVPRKESNDSYFFDAKNEVEVQLNPQPTNILPAKVKHQLKSTHDLKVGV